MTARGRLGALLAVLVICGLAGAAVAAAESWTTYHHDAGRSGIDPDSTSPVAPSQVWQTPDLDGPVWSQPLVYGGVVYVATENDTVYALNESTGSVVWQRHLATPVPSGQLSCGDIQPNVGITSTPVIDPATGRIYVVADTWNGSTITHDMYALNLSDGSVGVGPVSVEPPGDTPKDQLQRASLALDAGKIIIGYGGNDGDCGNYHGWLVAVPEGGGGIQTYEVDSGSGHSAGAIWGSGNAPAVDSAGDIWISTGNGNSSGSFDFSESVIKLDPNLTRLDYWAPTTWSSLDGSDTDLGSTMPLLVPGGSVFEIGKGGTGYLLNASSLGGVSNAPFSANVCSGSWGGGMYVNGVIYVSCRDGMHALALNTAARTFSSLAGWSVNSSATGPPIYAGGLVWAASGLGSDNGTLYALDPSSGATRFSANLGGFEHFTTPSAGGGRLFVANDSKITAFQIATPLAPGPGAGTPGTGTPGTGAPSPTARSPIISHLGVRVVRHKLRISLTLSEPAQIVVGVSKLVPGRRSGGACRMRARHGRRCTATLHRLTLRLRGRRGSDRFRPRMHALPSGRYQITVRAIASSGARSKAHRVVIVV